MNHHPKPAQSTPPPAARSPLPGIYIHVPFCRRKCRYCTFASTEDLSLQHAYTAAVCREMEMVEEGFSPFDTLYVGGGTPTAMAKSLLLRILERAFAVFAVADSPEVTVEANPGTVSLQTLRQLRRAGVNRINLGVQSFSDRNLGFLGRIHSAKEAAHSIALARQAGFDNVGFDLIYGLPGQDRDAWRKDLDRAVSLSPEHLSCYMLTFESGTPLARDLDAGRIQSPEEHTVADLFAATSETLQDRGYIHYEISNFARSQDLRSRHNQKYWSLAPTLGLGPSAHSHFTDPPSRWWNLRKAADYIIAVKEGRRPVSEKEDLTPDQCLTETVFLSLRTAAGIEPAAVSRRFGISFEDHFGELVSELEADGMLERRGSAWVPTLKGMLFADTVAARFVERI